MLNCMLQRRLNECILGADIIISGGSQAKLDLVEQQCYGTGRQVYRYIIQAFIIDIYIYILSSNPCLPVVCFNVRS